MKTVFQLLMAVVLSGPLQAIAQDVIYKSDGTKVQAKVAEVGISEIRYKLFSNPDGPVFVLRKSDVVLIAYQNGEHEMVTSLSDRERKKQAKNDSLALNRRKNIVSVNLLDAAFGNMTFSYERVFGKGYLGIKVPVSLGLRTLSNYGYYAGTYDRSRIMGTGLDVNFYPNGQGTVRYFIGPSVSFGTFRYRDYYPYDDIGMDRFYPDYYPYMKGTHLSLSVNNGLMIQPSKHLTIALAAGMGMKMDFTRHNDRIVPKPSASVNFGYRF